MRLAVFDFLIIDKYVTIPHGRKIQGGDHYNNKRLFLSDLKLLISDNCIVGPALITGLDYLGISLPTITLKI